MKEAYGDQWANNGCLINSKIGRCDKTACSVNIELFLLGLSDSRFVDSCFVGFMFCRIPDSQNHYEFGDE